MSAMMKPSILNSLLSELTRRPLITGIVCAGGKGCLADALSQKMLQDGEYKAERTVAFGLWNAIYCGAACFAMYSVLAPRLLPLRLANGMRHPHATRNTLALVAFDNLVATPLVCLPTYYAVHAFVTASHEERRRPVALTRSALQTYARECVETLSLSWSFWVPIHLVTFSIVPTPLRVHFTAVMSGVTLTFMSLLQSVLEDRRALRDKTIA